MIKYAVKKCDSFGFAPSLEKAKSLFNDDELQNIVYIDDDHPIPDTVEKKCIFFVTLGKYADVEYEELETNEEDLTYLENLLKTDTEHKEAILSCIELYKNKNFFEGKSFTGDFCEFLISLYPHLKDSVYKKAIFKVLKDEHLSELNELYEKYPLTFVTRTKNVVLNTKPFEDVKIIVDKDDDGISSSIYKNRADAQKMLVGNSVYIEAMSSGKFTIVKGKRSAGFDYENRLMNHDTLDLLVKNGIVCSPEDMDKGSFSKLMKLFSTCDSFSVIFIHPSLVSKEIRVEQPCDPALPEYITRSGEILAVAFRYICMNFFGYKGVHDESLKEYEYLF